MLPLGYPIYPDQTLQLPYAPYSFDTSELPLGYLPLVSKYFCILSSVILPSGTFSSATPCPPIAPIPEDIPTLNPSCNPSNL